MEFVGPEFPLRRPQHRGIPHCVPLYISSTPTRGLIQFKTHQDKVQIPPRAFFFVHITHFHVLVSTILGRTKTSGPIQRSTVCVLDFIRNIGIFCGNCKFLLLPPVLPTLRRNPLKKRRKEESGEPRICFRPAPTKEILEATLACLAD